MTPKEAFIEAVNKMMNRRYRPETYADLFETESTTRDRIFVLKDRFSWSRYQAEEVIRMIRILLPSHQIDASW
jgi:hypothetical protein